MRYDMDNQLLEFLGSVLLLPVFLIGGMILAGLASEIIFFILDNLMTGIEWLYKKVKQ